MSLQSTPLPKMKLTYFNGMGRAEATRLALAIGGIEYEDERVEFSDWMSVKPTLPFKAVPVLQVGDEVLSQSVSILRYVGKLAGLYPTDALLAQKVDEVIDAIEDVNGCLDPTYAIPDLAEKIAIRQKLQEERMKPLLECLEARVGSGGFAVGNQPTIADLRIAAMVANVECGALDGLDPLLFSDFKKLSAISVNTHLIPAVAAWNRKQNIPKLRLVYFDMGGRAEAIRLALYSAGIEFEDERIDKLEWANRKPDAPFGQLPVLHIGNEVVSQSDALLRYVGRLSETYPLDPLAAWKVDEIIGGINDAQNTVISTFSLEGDAKIAKRKELVEGKLFDQMKALDTRVAKHSRTAGFSVGNSLTIADTVIYAFMLWGCSGVLDGIPASFYEQFENLMAVKAKVCENEGIAAYLSKKK